MATSQSSGDPATRGSGRCRRTIRSSCPRRVGGVVEEVGADRVAAQTPAAGVACGVHPVGPRADGGHLVACVVEPGVAAGNEAEDVVVTRADVEERDLAPVIRVADRAGLSRRSRPPPAVRDGPVNSSAWPRRRGSTSPALSARPGCRSVVDGADVEQHLGDVPGPGLRRLQQLDGRAVRVAEPPTSPRAALRRLGPRALRPAPGVPAAGRERWQ